ncbi:MAG: dynamin family protein [Thermoguttaceae bacterium]|jgi:GTP-binding protein EngB required for normal cell division|nr:dynamin family protein [Thermoguttaceae bacterium]
MLNPLHKNALLSTFLHIESRLNEMEPLLAQGKRPSPLDPYVHDLSPTEAKVVEDYFARIRSTMVTCLEKHGIPLEVHRVSLRWSLQTGVNFLSVAVAEVSPDRLRGYGELDEAGRQAVESIQQEIDRLLDRVAAYLSDRLGHNLPERIARLDAAPGSVAMLDLLNRIVMRWQLVEFRPAIDTIVQRLECPQFEIAVFGRVSSGKSSLLNHIAGSDVLPVGVTPVTAVPTRLMYGRAPGATVFFAEFGPRRVDPNELAEYASEAKNRGNHKHVTGIVVEMPSPRLREGVVLVDTPGIGSLATSGSAETFAYLPRCDLSVVLIDAGSTLNHEDLSLLRDLYEAGIPAQVLLSKADLLPGEDRQRVLQYIRDQIRQELDLDLAVCPVSVMGQEATLLDHWFEQEIAPLWERHRTLAEQSLHRKIARLRESVIAVLRTLLAKRQGKAPAAGDSRQWKAVEGLLDEAEAAIQRAQTRQRDWSADEPALVEIILREAAKAVVESARPRKQADRHVVVEAGNQPEVGGGPFRQATSVSDSSPAVQAIQESLIQVGQMAREVVTGLQKTLSRTLDALEKAVPWAKADTAALRGAPVGGLPVIDLSPLSAKCKCSIPRWAAWVPAMARWMARRSVDTQLAEPLRRSVRLYNAQLGAWLKTSISSIVEPYQSQAEVFREQLRRMTTGAEANTAGDVADLIRDLEELEQAGIAQSDASGGGEASPPPTADGEGASGRFRRDMTFTRSMGQ